MAARWGPLTIYWGEGRGASPCGGGTRCPHPCSLRTPQGRRRGRGRGRGGRPPGREASMGNSDLSDPPGALRHILYLSSWLCPFTSRLLLHSLDTLSLLAPLLVLHDAHDLPEIPLLLGLPPLAPAALHEAGQTRKARGGPGHTRPTALPPSTDTQASHPPNTSSYTPMIALLFKGILPEVFQDALSRDYFSLNELNDYSLVRTENA